MEEQANPASDGEKTAQQSHRQPRPSAPPQVAKTEGSMPQKPATAQQLEKVDEKMSAFERSTLKWARVAVFVSGLAFVLICAQWWEMHTSSSDTHNLAVAAGNQAIWIENLAVNMQTQADRTQILADRMKDQAQATNELAGAAGRSAAASESANSQSKQLFQLQNRPWVGVDGEVSFDQKGLNWVGQKNEAVEVRERRIHYPLRNFGGGPAMNTQLVIQPITFPYSGTGSQESAIKSAIEQSCKIAEGAIKRNNGDLILPGGKQTVPYQYWITDRNTFVFTPGCIVYRDREGNLHHTRICYAAALFVTPEPTSLETCQDQSAD